MSTALTSPQNPNPQLRIGVMKFGAWSGIIFLIVFVIGWIAIARFLPPPSPLDNSEQVALWIDGNRSGIRFGMIVVMFSAVFLAPFAAIISIQMRRIEGRGAVLAWTQFGLGAILVLGFIYLAFFWQVATFRVDRPAADIQLANDMAWVPFIGLTATAAMQSAVYGVSILLDKRPNPVFPRWLGYFNLWAALLFCPGTFNVFFKTGPLAWDGLISYYLPLGVFFAWMFLNSWALLKAIDHQVQEEAMVEPPAAPDAATVAELRAGLAQINARLDALRSPRADTVGS